MNFGKGIFIAFVLFATFMATLVTVCVRQNISLVSKDYYQEELRHQQKIDRLVNANNLEHKPVVSIAQGEVVVDFDQFSQLQEGEIKLLRPSDPSLDTSFPLQSSNTNRQVFTLTKWQSGLYRVSISWKVKDKEFIMEQIMVL